MSYTLYDYRTADRDCAMPYQQYEGQNLSGNISRLRARLAGMVRDRVGSVEVEP